MTQNSSDTQSADLPTDVEQNEPADLVPDSDASSSPDVAPAMPEPESTKKEAEQDAPDVAPEVEQPSDDVPATPTEGSAADVAPAADDAPAEQPSAEATPSEQPAEANAEAAPSEQPSETPEVSADQAPLSGDTGQQDPPPGAGPRIIGRAEDVTPPPVPAVKASLKDVQRQQRPRRRRLNATQRHRNVFFARLNEFRRQAQPRTDHEAEVEAAEAEAAAAAQAEAADTQATEAAAEASEAPVEATEAPAADVTEAPAVEPAADAAEAPAAEAADEAPDATEAPAADAAEAPVTDAGEAPAAADAPAEDAAPATGEAPSPAAEAAEEEHGDDQGPQQKRRSTPPPPVDRPRLVAAIDRAGGPEVVMEALQPKRDENDQPLKWATVCADACKGLKPSDPVFSAWVRLAATPVSAIKNELGINDRRPERGRGRGPRRGGRDDRGPRRGRDDRGGVSREDFQRLSRGGSVGANIRIIGLNDEIDEKQEREARRKAEREAKRQAERERLARLGY